MAKITLRSLRFNLLLVLGLSILILALSAWGIRAYTRHGVVVHIPELRGKDLATAQSLLEEVDLRHEVVDSIYDPTQPGGTVAELVPSAGSTVKPGRIIFVKIYAYEPRKISLPYVKDLSVRQAEALLRSQGFEHVELKEVQGEYLGLAVGIEGVNGQILAPGTLLSKNARITLLITGKEELAINIDSMVEHNDEARLNWESDTETDVQQSQDELNNQTDQEQWW